MSKNPVETGMRFKDVKTAILRMVELNLPVLITGAPGIGKSDLVKLIAEELDEREMEKKARLEAQGKIEEAKECRPWKFLISHPVVSDPTDYKGMPFVVNGQADFIPFGDLKTLVETEDNLLFLLDDVGQAPPTVQAALMQLLLARRVNDKEISKRVRFIACTNRKEDQAGVTGLLEPVKSRFGSIIHMEPNVDDWTTWAASNGIPVEVIAYVNFDNSALMNQKASKDLVNTPNPRTVAHAGRIFESFREGDEKVNTSNHILRELLTGAAGSAFSHGLMAFVEKLHKLDDPKKVLAKPDTYKWYDDLEMNYAMCAALAYNATEKTIDNFFKIVNKVPQEIFQIFMLRLAIKKNASDKTENFIITSAGFDAWAEKVADFFM